ALAAALLLAVILFFVLGLHHEFTWEHVRGNLDHWQTQVQEHPVAAVVLFFLLYVTITGLSLPVAAVVALVGGALFGPWLGTAVVSLASTLGAALAFLSSRYLLRDWVTRHFGDRLRAVNRGIERDGAWYLFSLRLAPVVPFFLINLGMGLTP